MNSSPCPFEVGQIYSVLKSFKSLNFEFVPGQKLTFIGHGYNRYDSMTIYNFQSRNGDNYQWWRHDDVPLESWKDLFKPEYPSK